MQVILSPSADVAASSSNPPLPPETRPHRGAGGGEEAAEDRNWLPEVHHLLSSSASPPLLSFSLLTVTCGLFQVLCRRSHYCPVWEMVFLSGSQNRAGANNWRVRVCRLCGQPHDQVVSAALLYLQVYGIKSVQNWTNRARWVSPVFRALKWNICRIWTLIWSEPSSFVLTIWMNRWFPQRGAIPDEHSECDVTILLQRLAWQTEASLGQRRSCRYVWRPVWDRGTSPATTRLFTKLYWLNFCLEENVSGWDEFVVIWSLFD